MSKEIILMGGGGHCRSVIDVIEQQGEYKIIGIIDQDESKVGSRTLGYEIIGTENILEDFCNIPYAFVTVGQLDSHVARTKIKEKLERLGFVLPTIISPMAYVSRHAKIGAGTVVMHDAVVNAGALVGQNCIINTKALIEHDSVIESGCHISTGAIVNGGVVVKSGTFFGSNATSKQYEEIKPGSFIKAGTVAKGK